MNIYNAETYKDFEIEQDYDEIETIIFDEINKTFKITLWNGSEHIVRCVADYCEAIDQLLADEVIEDESEIANIERI